MFSTMSRSMVSLLLGSKAGSLSFLVLLVFFVVVVIFGFVFIFVLLLVGIFGLVFFAGKQRGVGDVFLVFQESAIDLEQLLVGIIG